MSQQQPDTEANTTVRTDMQRIVSLGLGLLAKKPDEGT
jgi:hypothetical protein